MSWAEEIARRRSALLDLAGALGIGQYRLSANENAAQITVQESVSSDSQRWDPIDQARFAGWFTRLGAMLAEVRFELPGQAAVIARPASPSRAALEPLLAAARNQGSDLEVTITINKKPFERHLAGTLAGVGSELRIAVFFFGAALHRILSRDDAHYRFFEEHFLEATDQDSPDRLLLILVADLRGWLRGPYLAILGMDHLDEATAFLAAADRRFEILKAARELMKLECLWDQRPWLLAPDFFALDVEDHAGLQVCRRSLQRLQNQLSIPYLANWTAGPPENPKASFEGNRDLCIDAVHGSKAPFDLYGWAYRDPAPASSKLAIVRRVMASRLPSGTKTLTQLVADIPDLLSECRVQLRLLMNENLAESFERRERIETLVRGYVDQVSQQIESLSKEVVDNAYKTVGLLVGVAIAYLLKPEGGTVILALGLSVYAGYVLFILLFYLRSLEQEQEAREQAFDAQRTELERLEVLTAQSRQRLGSVKEQDRKLEKKLRTVRTIYWTLVAAAVIGMLAWLGWKALPERPEAVRNRAVSGQAEQFKRFGYQDVRANLEGRPMPDPLLDTGPAVLPDVTAIRKADRRFLVVSWVPCRKIGKPAELQRLSELQALAKHRNAELQVLTEAVCAGDAGEDRARSWLERALPGLKIWTR